MIKVAIIGGGGHARVLSEVISHNPELRLVGCFDDSLERGTELWDGVKVLGAVNELGKIPDPVDAYIIGIGNNAVRKKIVGQYPDLNWISLVHPRAIISPSAEIGKGSVVLAGAVVSTNAKIGTQVIVNANVTVDHDTKIGDYVHLSIGSLVGSNSIIEESCLIGIGQIVPSFSTITE
ncbi:transferase [Fluviicola sp.]|uniref:PglD-related sugar-binding protein n=1 Tax=Fluviicola sp. TaxID=1917219 RepID=UPI0031D7082A